MYEIHNILYRQCVFVVRTLIFSFLFILRRNDFSGSLQGLRSLNKLRWVTLGNNRFTGSIPSDFFNENMIHLGTILNSPVEFLFTI